MGVDLLESAPHSFEVGAQRWSVARIRESEGFGSWLPRLGRALRQELAEQGPEAIKRPSFESMSSCCMMALSRSAPIASESFQAHLPTSIGLAGNRLMGMGAKLSKALRGGFLGWMSSMEEAAVDRFGRSGGLLERLAWKACASFFKIALLAAGWPFLMGLLFFSRLSEKDGETARVKAFNALDAILGNEADGELLSAKHDGNWMPSLGEPVDFKLLRACQKATMAMPSDQMGLALVCWQEALASIGPTDLAELGFSAESPGGLASWMEACGRQASSDALRLSGWGARAIGKALESSGFYDWARAGGYFSKRMGGPSFFESLCSLAYPGEGVDGFFSRCDPSLASCVAVICAFCSCDGGKPGPEIDRQFLSWSRSLGMNPRITKQGDELIRRELGTYKAYPSFELFLSGYAAARAGVEIGASCRAPAAAGGGPKRL